MTGKLDGFELPSAFLFAIQLLVSSPFFRLLPISFSPTHHVVHHMSHHQNHSPILSLAQDRQSQKRNKECDKPQIQPPEMSVSEPLNILIVHGRRSVPVKILFRVGRPVPAVPVHPPVYRGQ